MACTFERVKSYGGLFQVKLKKVFVAMTAAFLNHNFAFRVERAKVTCWTLIQNESDPLSVEFIDAEGTTKTFWLGISVRPANLIQINFASHWSARSIL